MIAKYKTKSNIFITVWLILQLAGLLARSYLGDVGVFISLVGGACLIIGCCYYSKAKGHHAAWGLLGLLSLIGLIILVCFTDKNKQQS